MSSSPASVTSTTANVSVQQELPPAYQTADCITIIKEDLIYSRRDLILQTLADSIVNEEDKSEFLLLCKRLSSLIRSAYMAKCDKLLSRYSLFDPRERHDWSTTPLALAQVERMEEDFLVDFIAVLDRASYKPLSKAEQELALSQQYSLTVPVAVDEDKLDTDLLTRVLAHEEVETLFDKDNLAGGGQQYLIFRRGIEMDHTTSDFFIEKVDVLLARLASFLTHDVLRIPRSGKGAVTRSVQLSTRRARQQQQQQRETGAGADAEVVAAAEVEQQQQHVVSLPRLTAVGSNASVDQTIRSTPSTSSHHPRSNRGGHDSASALPASVPLRGEEARLTASDVPREAALNEGLISSHSANGGPEFSLETKEDSLASASQSVQLHVAGVADGKNVSQSVQPSVADRADLMNGEGGGRLQVWWEDGADQQHKNGALKPTAQEVVRYDSSRLDSMPLSLADFFRSTAIKEPTFRHMIVVHRPKETRPQGEDSSLGDRHIVVRHYQSIPMADMEIVLPEVRNPSLRPHDWMRFFFTTWTALCAIMGLAHFQVLNVAVIAAFAFAAIKEIRGIYILWSASLETYQGNFVSLTYNKLVDSGRGTILNIGHQVIKQEIKETVLAIYILQTAGRCTLQELNERCEKLLFDVFNECLDVDLQLVCDRLEKLGIVMQDDVGRLIALPLKTANDVLGISVDELMEVV